MGDLELTATFPGADHEGPVHPYQVREPVSTGASGRQNPSVRRALYAQKSWQRGAFPLSSLQRPETPYLPPKFARTGRRLLVLMGVVAMALAIMVTALTLVGQAPRPMGAQVVAQPGLAAFAAKASRACTADLPPDRSMFLATGSSTAVAAGRLTLLRGKVSALATSVGFSAVVEAWLSHWQKFLLVERTLTALGQQHQEGQVTPAEHSAVSLAQQKADDEAALADRYADNLQVPSCRLGLGAAER